MKICTKCNTNKPLSDFYSSKATKTSPSGVTYWCKECYAENYANNRERQLKSNEKARIKRRYGLTVEEYTDLINSGCTVCGDTTGRVVMDHCHVSGFVRGALCNGCNVALGSVQDNPETLRKLAVYLEEGRNISQGLKGPSY